MNFANLSAFLWAALAIPIIIHLLNRRRFEVIDWGAMRFLQVSKVTRRRLFLEELLLLLLRMGLIGLLVVALAGPAVVVLALRADFYDRPLLYPGFSELMRDEELTPAQTRDRPGEVVGGLLATLAIFGSAIAIVATKDAHKRDGAARRCCGATLPPRWATRWTAPRC